MFIKIKYRLPISRNYSTLGNSTIITEKNGTTGIITLNRPKQLNAINSTMQDEILLTVQEFDTSPDIKCIIITGTGNVFSAGADLKELSTKPDPTTIFRKWNQLKNINKPIIGAVNGIAYGGGCELAMFTDIILASEKAEFSQPEIKHALIPGMGGTQRLTKFIGKSNSMLHCLTGRPINALTAVNMGLVSIVTKHGELMKEALILSNEIGSMSVPMVTLIKKCINESYETNLEDGINYEWSAFLKASETKDYKEGIASFLEKRQAKWTNE